MPRRPGGRPAATAGSAPRIPRGRVSQELIENVPGDVHAVVAIRAHVVDRREVFGQREPRGAGSLSGRRALEQNALRRLGAKRHRRHAAIGELNMMRSAAAPATPAAERDRAAEHHLRDALRAACPDLAEERHGARRGREGPAANRLPATRSRCCRPGSLDSGSATRPPRPRRRRARAAGAGSPHARESRGTWRARRSSPCRPPLECRAARAAARGRGSARVIHRRR